MTTFTLNNGNTYTQQDNGYCFAAIDGKKIRCSTASFKMAYDQFVKEENERQNAANKFTNIEPLTEAEFEAAVEEAEESATTEEIKQIQKEMAPKAKKARKSKDIAFEYRYNTIDDPEGEMVTLTTKQVDFLREMVNTMAWDGFDHPLHIDLLVDEIGGQFAGKPMTVGAMISTLCEKGLGEREITRRDNHKCTSFTLSPRGVAVAAELGL